MARCRPAACRHRPGGHCRRSSGVAHPTVHSSGSIASATPSRIRPISQPVANRDGLSCLRSGGRFHPSRECPPYHGTGAGWASAGGRAVGREQGRAMCGLVSRSRGRARLVMLPSLRKRTLRPRRRRDSSARRCTRDLTGSKRRRRGGARSGARGARGARGRSRVAALGGGSIWRAATIVLRWVSRPRNGSLITFSMARRYLCRRTGSIWSRWWGTASVLGGGGGRGARASCSWWRCRHGPRHGQRESGRAL